MATKKLPTIYCFNGRLIEQYFYGFLHLYMILYDTFKSNNEKLTSG